MNKYWWIRDASPSEVQAKTGMLGVPTPQGGTLVEAREPVDVDRLMEESSRHPPISQGARRPVSGPASASAEVSGAVLGQR